MLAVVHVERPVMSLAVLSNGERLAVVGSFGYASVWDVKSGRRVSVLTQTHTWPLYLGIEALLPGDTLLTVLGSKA